MKYHHALFSTVITIVNNVIIYCFLSGGGNAGYFRRPVVSCVEKAPSAEIRLANTWHEPRRLVVISVNGHRQTEEFSRSQSDKT